VAGRSHYVRSLRLAQGLKQVALAEMLGVTQQMVSAWERGVYEPGPRMRQRLIELMQQERSLEDRLLLNLVRRSSAMHLVGPEGFVVECGTKTADWLGVPQDEVANRGWRNELGDENARITDLVDASGIYEGKVASLTYINRITWRGRTSENVAFNTPLIVGKGVILRCAVYHRNLTPDEFRRRYPGKDLVIETFEDIEDFTFKILDWKRFGMLGSGLNLLGWL
jgi:transcriptional regulator with XRE-family HTH domain